MTPSVLLSSLRAGETIQIPLSELSRLLLDAPDSEVLQIVTLVTKGNAYLQLYRQIEEQSFQNN